MIIDSHVHVYPDKIAVKAAQSVGHFYDIPMTNESGSVSALLEIGGRAGVDKFLIHSVATTPHQVGSINNFIAANIEAHPGKFIGFASMHPDLEDQEAELERALQIGLQGVKLHPDVQQFAIDDRRMWPTYRFCSEHGMPILFHTGDHRYEYSNPRIVVRLLEAFPDLKLICAHFGGWSEWDEAERLLPQTGVMVDCSSSFYALTDERIMELINAYGTDRIFFGSDFPMWDPKAELERLHSLPLSENDIRKIESENLIKFLGLKV